MELEDRVDKQGDLISEMSAAMSAHINYYKGLELADRVRRNDKKPGWMGLSGAITALGIILTVIFTAMKG